MRREGYPVLLHKTSDALNQGNLLVTVHRTGEKNIFYSFKIVATRVNNDHCLKYYKEH